MVTDEEKRFWEAEARKWQRISLVPITGLLLFAVIQITGGPHAPTWLSTIAVVGMVAGIGFPYAHRRYMAALQKAGKPWFTGGLVGWWLRRKGERS